MSSPIIYAIVGRTHRPAQSGAPPWEVVSYPGRMAVYGDTWDEGREAMKTMIDQILEYQPKERRLPWFAAQKAKMNDEQRAFYEAVVGESAGKPDGIKGSDCSEFINSNLHVFFAIKADERIPA